MGKGLIRTSFRAYLEQEFSRRQARNSRYSLCSFARQLEVDPGPLSQMLRGTRAISTEMIRRLGGRLSLTQDEIQKYIKDRENPQHDFEVVSEETFKAISHWWHFTILELMNVENFKSDPLWIAEALQISEDEVKAAIKRLVHLGFLDTSGEKWKDLTTGQTCLGPSHVTNRAFKEYQKQMLAKAATAMDRVPIEEREQSGTTMSVNSRNIKKARALIKKFHREMAALMTGEGEDEVYHLSISLFPLTQAKGADS